MARCQTFQLALSLFELTRAEWLSKVRAWAFEQALQGRELTTDDIHDHLPLPAEHDPRAYGSVFASREWESTGVMVKSRRSECHHRKISVFRLRSGFRAEKSYPLQIEKRAA